MRVGLIGLGAIGRQLLALVRPDDALGFIGAVVADPSKSRPPGSPPV